MIGISEIPNGILVISGRSSTGVAYAVSKKLKSSIGNSYRSICNYVDENVVYRGGVMIAVVPAGSESEVLSAISVGNPPLDDQEFPHQFIGSISDSAGVYRITFNDYGIYRDNQNCFTTSVLARYIHNMT